MISRYRVTAPVRAILDKPEGGRVSVTLPVGAVLYESSPHSSTLFGWSVWCGEGGITPSTRGTSTRKLNDSPPPDVDRMKTATAIPGGLLGRSALPPGNDLTIACEL